MTGLQSGAGSPRKHMIRALSTGVLLLAGWAAAGLAASSGSGGRFSK